MEIQRLFTPGIIGNMEVKNRTIMSPMLKNYGNRNGKVSQRYIDYFAARAKGGTGLILAEAVYISPESKGNMCQLGIHNDSVIEGYRKLIDAVHQHGCKIGLEIQHRGKETSSVFNFMQPVAPSCTPYDASLESGFKRRGDTPRELSIAEIEELIKKFAAAAVRNKEAGFDLVEIHGGHGYLIEQFLSPHTNKRNDKYGGSKENRSRFPLEVVEAVRKAVGDDYPISYRISGDEYVDGGMVIDDILPFVTKLEAAGIDMIDVSGGIHETIYMIVPPMDIPLGCHVHLASAIKEVVDIPVAVVGRINDPIQSDMVLVENNADFVVLGRALHADPEFVNKAKEGKYDEIRNCLACNQGCIDVLTTRSPVKCVVNVAAGREREFIIKKAEKKKKVVIIGGGPGGMEAARIAKLRGHEVLLYEKYEQLGGQVNIAKKAPNMEGIEDSIRFLSTQMNKLGVTLKVGVEATPEMIESEKPDAVIMATGSIPYKPMIPGIDQPHVYTAWDVLEGKADIGKKTVILGADLVACETALYTAKRNVKTIIITPEHELAEGEGTRVFWILLKQIENEPNIEVRLRTTMQEIKQNSIVIQNENNFGEIDGLDSVIISVGNASVNKLSDTIISNGKIAEIFTVGDCVQPRKLMDAIHEGAMAGMRI